MIIAIDIDDTLVTTTASVLAQHYADTGELVDINDVRTYRIEDYISEEYKDNFYKIFLKKEMWKRIKLLPNCVEAIKRLHEKQHQIYFCTSTEPQNIAKKFSFLRRTFPFINVRKALINTPNKQLIHFDVLIDDAVHNVIDAPYYSILFSQPWNENFDDAEHDNIFRVNDWTQVEDVVEFIERLKMGTNFYFQYDFGFGQVYEKHIAKTSCGWLPLFQQLGDIKSVKSLKQAYLAAPFKIVDEYGEEYTWDEFTERVLNWNKDNPKALSHIKPPEHFNKDNMRNYYGSYWSAERFMVDDEGYEFFKDEFS